MNSPPHDGPHEVSHPCTDSGCGNLNPQNKGAWFPAARWPRPPDPSEPDWVPSLGHACARTIFGTSETYVRAYAYVYACAYVFYFVRCLRETRASLGASPSCAYARVRLSAYFRYIYVYLVRLIAIDVPYIYTPSRERSSGTFTVRVYTSSSCRNVHTRLDRERVIRSEYLS